MMTCGHPDLFRDPDTGECAGCWASTRRQTPTRELAQSLDGFTVMAGDDEEDAELWLRCDVCEADVQLPDDAATITELILLAITHRVERHTARDPSPWPPPGPGDGRWHSVDVPDSHAAFCNAVKGTITTNGGNAVCPNYPHARDRQTVWLPVPPPTW